MGDKPKEYCAKGHPLAGDNIHIENMGNYDNRKRRCRICYRAWRDAYNARTNAKNASSRAQRRKRAETAARPFGIKRQPEAVIKQIKQVLDVRRLDSEPDPVGPIAGEDLDCGCKWIHGDVRSGEARYCGHPTEISSSYCLSHHGRVWLAPPPKNPRPW